MDRFKHKLIRLLVATDVAARGIDVSDLSHVINYNLPDQNKGYTHRSGRTGRAQKSGVSISILNPSEVKRIKELEGIIGKKFEYKKIPDGEEICTKQFDNFFEEIEKTGIKESSNEQYFSEITDKLKKINKEDLIKYFIIQKFSHLLDAYKNTRDLNVKLKAFDARRGGGDNVSLKINFGKKHGFDIKGFFALINSNKNLKGIEVGRIDLMPEYSIFSVEKKDADEVIKYLRETNFRGRKIDISRSNERGGYPQRRRGKSDKGFRKKRKGFKIK
jgi:ATP-dependent RNA helicase DeaD